MNSLTNRPARTRRAGAAFAALFCALGCVALPAMAQAQTYGELELYDLPDFRGERVLLARAVPFLGPGEFDDRTSSIAVSGGAWELCSAADYQGVCRTVTDDVWDLEALGLNDQISSIRPVDAALGAEMETLPGVEPLQPLPETAVTAPAADRMVGRNAAFFPAPDIDTRNLGACLAGATRACEQEVDRFCQSQRGGWYGGAFYSVDLENRRLTDVLCIR